MTGKAKLVTFDAGGTLLYPYPSVGVVYQRVLKRHALDYPVDELNQNFAQAFRNVSKDSSILDGEAREWSFWKSVVAQSIDSFDEQPKDFAHLFKDLWDEFSHGDCWRVCEGAHETLETLRSSGLKLALLTNWDSRVHRVLKETKLDKCFDHTFVSSEIGREKPDVQVFKHVEQVTGFTANQILHVGDSIKHDIHGARQAGWSSLLLSNNANVEAGSPVITTIPQVITHI